MSTWQTKSSKVVYESPWLIVHEDQVIMPSGQDGMYGYVESKSDSVFVVPVDDEGNTYIVQQEHYTTREMTWQCVAGRTDGEPAETAAKRELLEEAGLRARTIEILSKVRTATGMTTFQSTICIARGLEPDTSLLDKGEISEAKKVSFEEVKDMIFRGEINSTESIAAFLMAIAHLENKKAV